METVQLLYKYLNILSPNLNRKRLCGKLMQKLIYNQHPKIIENKFLLQHNESIINLGHQKLVIHFRRATVVVSSLMYQGFKISNEFPLTFKKLKSSKLFYKNSKEHLLLSMLV